MFCNKCGKEVDADSKFCGSCGKEIKETVQSPVSDSPSDQTKRNISFDSLQGEENSGVKPKKQRDLSSSFVVIAVFLIAAFYFYNKFSDTSEVSAPIVDEKLQMQNESPDDFLVDNLKANGDQYSTTISGVVTNKTGKHFSTVIIQFNLYDKGNTQVGSASDIVSNLAPHSKWKFHTTAQAGFDHFDVQSIHGY